MTGNWINLLGLVFDIFGAILLGRAVVFNSTAKIAQQVATAWNYNKRLIPAVVEQRIDGVLGLVLLIAGFVLQGISDFRQGEPQVFAHRSRRAGCSAGGLSESPTVPRAKRNQPHRRFPRR